uniref:Uncharacterized protein n=1 Tax=viral metagenome TaxID=1070528 RepID=A0A6M3LYD7_9ZZZZ
MFIVENLAVNGAYLSADVAAGATSITVRAIGNLATGNAYLWDKDTPIGETVNITVITGTTLTIPLGVVGNYTVSAAAVITNTAGIPLGNIVEFDLPITSPWVKLAYVKIVQYQPGAMDISFDIFEKSGIDESIRRNLIYNVYRRNIDIAATAGGQYGEAPTTPIPYKDRDPREEEGGYNLHCRIQNEAGGTISDFGIVIKLAETAEVV